MPKVGRKEVKEVGCGITADWNHPLLHLARFIGRSGHWRTTIVWLRSKNHVRGCRTCSWTSLCADSLAANSPTGSNNICDPKSIFTLPRLSFADTRRATKNLKCPPPAFPAEVGQSNALPSFFFFFSSPVANKCSFCGPFHATFLAFVCFMLLISPFEIAPKLKGYVRRALWGKYVC